MNFKNIEQIKEAGFTGFKTVRELSADSSEIPQERGIYLVLNPNQSNEFLSVGCGGHFKGRDPNVSISKLAENWVENTVVVYIGKAGKTGTAATLQSRLQQYLNFGKGQNVGHWGGRFIWQLKNSSDLVVCWKTLPTEDPREVEKNLIKEFISEYSKRPFANLVG